MEALLSDLKGAQAFLGSPDLPPNALPGVTLPPCVQTGNGIDKKSDHCF